MSEDATAQSKNKTITEKRKDDLAAALRQNLRRRKLKKKTASGEKS